MRLPNLEGYLKFPGPLPVASIRLQYVKRSASAERFVPREADAGEADTSGDASVETAAASEVPPEEPEGWFGQGELDLFGAADSARSSEVDAGSASPAAGMESEGCGSAKEEAGEPDDARVPAGFETGEDAAGPEDAPTEKKTAPATQPEPARAQAGDRDGLIRF